jgi:sulfate transport system substrate-binding protein
VDVNKAFTAEWEKANGKKLVIEQSHGGSGKQARSVIDGLNADIVTLALAGDIDVLSREADLLPKEWQSKLPDNSSPYTSTIVLVVRKGSPKGISDWGDLVKPGV